MKKIIASILCLSLAAGLAAQNDTRIIPLPASVTTGKGNFRFSSSTTLAFKKKDEALQTALSPLIIKCRQAAGIDLLANKPGPERRRPSLIKDLPANKSSIIEVKIDKTISEPEGYHLIIQPEKISLSAATPVGIFYGVQSLLQLLPDAIEEISLQQGIDWTVPCVTIIDAPRFPYRGIMLDVARHYMPPEFIIKLIDLLAMQKMNRLHLHLTDSQGWRFESKKYPKLTQIGAWRKGTPLNTTYDYDSRPADSLYGGFYTQDQLRVLVQYAATRFITIIPEIEMPAHSKSALAAYPEYACLDSTGKPFAYPAQIQDEYCTKDETFTFLTDILSEVMDVFPSTYIHVAGDEASKVNWRTCPICQKRMKEEGLKNVEQLQSYFITRIEKFVNSRGRSIIGWDEILQGGLAPNATVMSWTGIEGGIKAAQQHHTVIMTPGDYCYLDHYQSDAPGEPVAFGGLTTLSKTYSYDPIPKELTEEEAKYILGAQGNLWTEYVPTPAKAEYMIFPRAIALAEVDWTPQASRNYDHFVARLVQYIKRLDIYKVNYSRHLFDIRLDSRLNNAGETIVSLSGVSGKYQIHYTVDGSLPTSHSPLYTTPFIIRQSCTLTAAVLADNDILDQLKKSFVLHKATAKKVTLLTPPSKYYNKGGDAAWVNGSLGNDERYNDDDWLGWEGQAFDGTIDFGTETLVSSLHTRFFHKPSAWIWMPRQLTVQVSADGVHFTTVATTNIAVPTQDGAIPVAINWPAASTRWLRIIADPYGLIPSGNTGEGHDAWLFVDEMIVDGPAPSTIDHSQGQPNPADRRTITGIDVQHYGFSLTLNDANNNIRGVADITLRFTREMTSFPLDLVRKNNTGKGMLVQSVTENGRQLRFEQDNGTLRIFTSAKPSVHTYTIRYEGIPVDGLIISTNKFGHRTFFGDNWPDRAHNWLPCQDHPSDKATVDFTVTAPDHYKVVANGHLEEETKLPRRMKKTHWKETAPLYSSLMVIGVADFAIDHAGNVKNAPQSIAQHTPGNVSPNITQNISQNIPVLSYVFPENKSQGFRDYSVAPDILSYYIRNFGPYAYEKLANVQSKTIFGGMENASAIFYFENSVGDREVEPLMAHEIAHQWFGDAVTEDDWQHLWLSEGFATYLTLLYMEHKYGTDTLQASLQKDRARIFEFEKQRFTPIVDTTVHDNYTVLLNANSYQKGSWVLHMLRHQIGDSIFRKGLAAYFSAYRNGNANTADFERVMETVSGQDLQTFFRQWLYAAGHPKLSFSWHYNPDQKQLSIQIDQQQDNPFTFPLEFSVNGVIHTVSINAKNTTVNLPLDAQPDSILPDPNTNLLVEIVNIK
jgi:hexosaminidase